MTRPTLSDARWFTSSANGCPEVAFLDDGRVAIRDDENLANPPFLVIRHVWECFIAGAAQGEFNPPAGA